MNISDFDTSENANEVANPAFAGQLGLLAQVLRQQFGSRRGVVTQT
jgi:hypothetical protein